MSETSERQQVLVVDDSRMMRLTMSKYLQPEFDVVDAVDGEDGWEKILENNNFAVVITDASMPRLDGYDLIKRARAHENAVIANLPIIMITGAEEADAREQALEIGATDFVVKPPEKTQLLARVRANARATQTSRELETTSSELAEQATLDPVTELTSRRYFTVRAEQDLAFVQRSDSDLSFISISIDNFDKYQEEHGEEVANNILRWIADVLRATTRKADTVSRIGTSRFAMLTPSTDRQAAANLCDRIRTEVCSKPFETGNVAIPISISIGLTCLRTDNYNTIDEYLEAAERRTHIAANKGGNQMIASDTAEAAAQPVQQYEPVRSLDEAVQLMEKGEYQRVAASLPHLLRKLFPILKLADKRYKLGFENFINHLKEKLFQKRKKA